MASTIPHRHSGFINPKVLNLYTVTRKNIQELQAMHNSGNATRGTSSELSLLLELHRKALPGFPASAGTAAPGGPRPAAILGFPVGFVGAAESKAALAADAHGIPFLTLRGRRGGSALAAAAVNALAISAGGTA